MLKFVKTAFRGFFEVILWINLILCAVGGGIIAHNFLWDSYHERGLHPVLGVLLGLIIGMLTNVVGGGFIATILNMDENLEQLRGKNDNSNRSSAGETSSRTNVHYVPPAPQAPAPQLNKDEKTNEKWICGKCGTTNEIFSLYCKKCSKEFSG